MKKLTLKICKKITIHHLPARLGFDPHTLQETTDWTYHVKIRPSPSALSKGSFWDVSLSSTKSNLVWIIWSFQSNYKLHHKPGLLFLSHLLRLQLTHQNNAGEFNLAPHTLRLAKGQTQWHFCYFGMDGQFPENNEDIKDSSNAKNVREVFCLQVWVALSDLWRQLPCQ